MMKILVCGGRDYNNRKRVYDILDKLYKKYEFTLLIQGGATGADTLAHEWCRDSETGVPSLTVFARWKTQRRGAGPIRNRVMLKWEPDIVVAFHDNLEESKGTKDMVNISLKDGMVGVKRLSDVLILKRKGGKRLL